MIDKSMLKKSRQLDVHILDEGTKRIYAIVGYKVIYDKETNDLSCCCEGDSAWNLRNCAHRLALLRELSFIGKLSTKTTCRQ